MGKPIDFPVDNDYSLMMIDICGLWIILVTQLAIVTAFMVINPHFVTELKIHHFYVLITISI